MPKDDLDLDEAANLIFELFISKNYYIVLICRDTSLELLRRTERLKTAYYPDTSADINNYRVIEVPACEDDPSHFDIIIFFHKSVISRPIFDNAFASGSPCKAPPLECEIILENTPQSEILHNILMNIVETKKARLRQQYLLN